MRPIMYIIVSIISQELLEAINSRFEYAGIEYKTVARISKTEYLCRPLNMPGDIKVFCIDTIINSIGKLGSLLYG